LNLELMNSGKEIDYSKCPKCGGPTKEQTKFIGCFCCADQNCKGLLITPTAARDLHQEICRQKGMTADEIIKEWNKASPDDEW